MARGDDDDEDTTARAATSGYIVRLRRNATGEVAEWVEPDFAWDEITDYLWAEGNYACDCNRSQFFAQAGGDLGDDDGECGDSRFTAIEAILPAGQRVPMDDA